MPESKPSLGGSFTLPPDDALAAFDRRATLRTSVRWHEVWEGAHANAFTAAKVAKLDLLRDIQSSLRDALANGQTFETWVKAVRPALEREGWVGLVQDAELTGTTDPVFVGLKRLRTIYDTNMRVSRAAGQWSRIQGAKASAPYLRYSAVMDDRTRPAHRAWHGTVLPVDHPWWDTHFPPCGWNCRCTVQQLSERDLARYKWRPSAAPPPEGPPQRFFRAGSPTPEFVPAGIDPGWGYNPGAAAQQVGVLMKATASIDAALGEGLADAARATLDELVGGEGFARFVAQPAGTHPALILSEADAAVSAAEAHGVGLPAEAMRALTTRYPDLTLDAWRALPAAGDAPIAVNAGAGRLLLVEAKGPGWQVVTVDGGEITNIEFAADEAALRELVGDGTLLRGALPPG